MRKAPPQSRRSTTSTKSKKTTRKTPRRRTEQQPMNDSQLEKLTLIELRELADLVDRNIVERQASERNNLRAKFEELAEEAGLSLADVLNGRGKSKSVQAKFVNPADPMETWSGRGRQPRWLVAKLKSGGSLDDFRV
jgi:DNA-binding protein H-NS